MTSRPIYAAEEHKECKNQKKINKMKRMSQFILIKPTLLALARDKH